MKILLKFTFCVFAMFLFVSGCGEPESTAPPVLSILDDLDGLKKEQDAQRMQKLREDAAAMAAANPSVSDNLMIPPDVPLTGKYTVRFETSAGIFVVEVDRSWTPVHPRCSASLCVQFRLFWKNFLNSLNYAC